MPTTKLDFATLTKADLEVLGVIHALGPGKASAAEIAEVLYAGDFTFAPERRHVTKVAMRCRSLERRGFIWHRWSDEDSSVRLYYPSVPRHLSAEALFGVIGLALFPEVNTLTTHQWAQSAARSLARKA